MTSLENSLCPGKLIVRGILFVLSVCLGPGTSYAETGSKSIKSEDPTPKQEEEEKAPKVNSREEFIKMNSLLEKDQYKVPPPAPKNQPTNEDAEIRTEALKAPPGPLPKVEIIVDSSGSMGQLLNSDKTKMYYSKKLLTRYLMDQWKQKALVGMRVYGSKRKNDCSDNFLSVPFRARSLEEIQSKVSNMLPVGRTPLQASVAAAIKDLKSYKGPKRIVIFTDGKETCGGDPCKLAEELNKNPNIDVKIYVVAIGFTPDSKDFEKVKCLGDTTTANSEEDLFGAMSKINSQVNVRDNLVVKSPDPMATVNLYRYVDGKKKYYRSFLAHWGVRVPPGEYEAEVALDPYYKFPRFRIPKGRRVHLVVEGKGEVLVKFSKGFMDVELLDKNMRPVHRFKSDRPFLAGTGRYKLRVSKPPYYSTVIPKFLVVPKGKHRFEVGDATVFQFNHPEYTGYYIYDGNDKLVGNYMTNVPVILKSGSYRIHLNESCHFKRVNISSGFHMKTISCESPKGQKNEK